MASFPRTGYFPKPLSYSVPTKKADSFLTNPNFFQFMVNPKTIKNLAYLYTQKSTFSAPTYTLFELFTKLFFKKLAELCGISFDKLGFFHIIRLFLAKI